MKKRAFFFAPFNEIYDPSLRLHLATAAFEKWGNSSNGLRWNGWYLHNALIILNKRPNCAVFFVYQIQDKVFKIEPLVGSLPVLGTETYETELAALQALQKSGFVNKMEYDQPETERLTTVL